MARMGRTSMGHVTQNKNQNADTTKTEGVSGKLVMKGRVPDRFTWVRKNRGRKRKITEVGGERHRFGEEKERSVRNQQYVRRKHKAGGVNLRLPKSGFGRGVGGGGLLSGLRK